MAKGYWIAHVDAHNEDGYKPYAAANPAIFKKFGGRFVVRGGKFENPEGASRSRNVIIEFPDYAAALACYRSLEYQANIKVRQPQRLGALIFVRVVAGERSGVVGEFAQHGAGPNAAFDHFHLAAAHQRGAAILFMRRRRRRHIGLVAFRIADIDLRNPIALGHGAFPSMLSCQFCRAAFAISATIACAAAFGSAAARIGRPTTR